MDIHYKAYDASGKSASGSIVASSEAEALEKLRGMGLLPYATSRTEKSTSLKSLLNMEIGRAEPNLSERATYAKMLSAMLQAGIPLDKAHRLLASEASTSKIAKLAAQIAEKLSAGSALSQILKSTPSGFAGDEIGLIQSGEQTGSLVQVLEELSTLLEKRLELRSKIVSASIYPAVLAVMALASLTVIATVLVPNIAPLFTQSDKELPALVWFTLAARNLIINDGWLVLAGVILFVAGVYALARNITVKRFFERVLYRRKIPRLLEMSRICRTLGTLIRNGVPLQQAIRMTADVVKGAGTREQLTAATDRVSGGTKLSHALKDVAVLTPAASQMIAIGEETNKVDVILLHLASTSEQEAGRGIERLMTLLTPLMTVGLGIMVGGLIMSVMRAILSVNDAVLP
jgi:general secretion pathway protein F